MTATITATAESAAVPPRVRLNVTTNQSTIMLYRVAQDGTRTPVRSYDGGAFPVSGGTLVAYDPEAPFGLPVTYTADGTGVTNSGTVTVSSDRVWLVHPGVPSRSQVVIPLQLSPRERDVAQSVRYPLGREFPIVATDGKRKAAQYELTLRTETLDQLAALDELLSDASPLLLNVPASWGWGVVSEYVAVGRISEARYPNVWGAHPVRRWSLPCSVVARPVGGSQVDNTYAKSKALYATYAARKAAHATYGQAFDPS